MLHEDEGGYELADKKFIQLLFFIDSFLFSLKVSSRLLSWDSSSIYGILYILTNSHSSDVNSIITFICVPSFKFH